MQLHAQLAAAFVGIAVVLGSLAIVPGGPLLGSEQTGTDAADEAARSLAPSGPVTWDATDVRVSDPATLFPGPVKDLYEPSIAIDPTNHDHMLAFGIDFSTQNYDAGVWSADRAYRSVDGGATWQDLGPMAPPDWDGGDPVVLFGPDGTAYYSELGKLVHPSERVGGILVYRMLPGQSSWGEPVIAVSRAAVGNDCPSPDKEWLSQGPDGTLYVVWTSFVYHCEVAFSDPLVGAARYKSASIQLTTSTDDGLSWSDPVTVFDAFAIGAIPLATPDGTLHVAHWSGAAVAGPGTCPGIRMSAASAFYEDPRALTTLVVSTSGDGGATWTHHTEPVCTYELDATTKAGSFQTGANPSIHRDPVSGDLYVVYPQFLMHEHRSTLMIISSADDGASWSQPREITAGTTDDAWLPTVQVDDAGTLHLAYISTRASDDTGAAVYQASTDGGQSWTAPVALSTQPWQMEDDPALGHYMELDIASERIAVAWTDARNGSPTEIWMRAGTIAGGVS